MRTSISKSSVVVLLFLSFGVHVTAQQPVILDDRIRSLSTNIVQLEARHVSADLQTMHRQNINEQRLKLIALLGEKKGQLQGYLDALSANLLATQKASINRQIRDLDSEIERQSESVKLNTAVVSGSGPLLQDGISTGNKAVALLGENGNGRGGRMENDVVQSNGGIRGGFADVVADGARVRTSQADNTSSANLIARTSKTTPGRVTNPTVTTSANTSKATAVVVPSSTADTITPGKCEGWRLLRDTSFSPVEQSICDLVQFVVDNAKGTELGKPEDIPEPVKAKLRPTIALEGTGDTELMKLISFRVAQNVAGVLGAAEDARTDKQVGGDSANQGTTSLVVKGGTPSVLGWAVENGAATSTRTGTTINFRFNPVGVLQALSNDGYLNAYRSTENDPLRKLSFGVSFDPSRGKEPGVFTGSSQQVSAFSARYEFVNERDPRNKKYAAEWRQLVANEQIDFTNNVVKVRAALVLVPQKAGETAKFKDQALQDWLAQTNAKLLTLKTQVRPDTPDATAMDIVEPVIRQQLEALDITKLDPNTLSEIASFNQSLGAYIKAREKLLDKIAKGHVISFEYTNHREVNAPDTSSLNFIFEKGSVNRYDLTLNAALTMYNRKPTGMDVKRIRDFLFSGQFDAPLREMAGVGTPVFSIAGKYERPTGNAIALDGTELPNTKGDIAAAQLKLTFPIKGTGIKLPISVTFANRTELVREKEVRANFGFTFDLDRLFANNPFGKLKP